MVGREITQRNATITALFIAGAAITFGVGSCRHFRWSRALRTCSHAELAAAP